MGESCDPAPAPPPWPQSRQSLTESFSTQTISPAPPSSLRGETVCLAPSSTRARGNCCQVFHLLFVIFCRKLPWLAGPKECSEYSWGSIDLKYNLCPPSSYLLQYTIQLHH